MLFLYTHSLRVMKQVAGVVVAFDFLEKIEIAKIRTLRVGEVAIGIVAVMAFDAVFREQCLNLIDRLDHARFALRIIPVALDF